MDKQKKQLIIVGILVIVLIFAGLSSFKKKPAGKTPVQIEPASQAAPEPPAAAIPGAAVRPDGKKINAQLERTKLPWGRDPFAAPAQKEYQIGELQLKGISFDKKMGGFAYINNDIVKKGDPVGNYEVVEIEKDRVLLKKGNQSFYLVFPGQE